jgi:hypothetical protein
VDENQVVDEIHYFGFNQDQRTWGLPVGSFKRILEFFNDFGVEG